MRAKLEGPISMILRTNVEKGESNVMASQQPAVLKWATLAIVIVAGAWTLFHLIWNVAGQKNDDDWGIALLILFLLALILAFVQFFQVRSALLAPSSAE